MAKIRLGIAPIAWTNDDMPDLGKENTFEQCVSEMALAGFTGCEVGGKYPKDTTVLKKALDLRGMSIASAWFSSFLLTQPYEQVEKDFIAHCEFLKTMGAEFCNVAEQGNSVQGKLDVPVFDGKPYNCKEDWPYDDLPPSHGDGGSDHRGNRSPDGDDGSDARVAAL